MKKLICLFLTLALILASAAAFSEAQPETPLLTPGTYTGEAQGIFVPVKVTVKVSEKEIETVLIDATGETPELGGIAAEKLAAAIINAQTPNVDAVAGATVTSNAIIAAATDALKQAGADIAVLDANRKDLKQAGSKTEKTIDTEIVIIGAGGDHAAAGRERVCAPGENALRGRKYHQGHRRHERLRDPLPEGAGH